jgi:hypothetical protein
MTTRDRPKLTGHVRRLDKTQREDLAEAIEAVRRSPTGTQHETAPSPAKPAPTQAPDAPSQQPIDTRAGADDSAPVGPTRSYIQNQIDQVMPLLDECYQHELALHPGIAGEANMMFTVDGEPEVGGLIRDPIVTGGALAKYSELRTCLQETMYSLALDPPEQGGRIEIEYALKFPLDPAKAPANPPAVANSAPVPGFVRPTARAGAAGAPAVR